MAKVRQLKFEEQCTLESENSIALKEDVIEYLEAIRDVIAEFIEKL